MFVFAKMDNVLDRELRIEGLSDDETFIINKEDLQCPYCQNEMKLIDGILKMNDGFIMSYFYECVSNKEENHHGCGAKFDFKVEHDESYLHKFRIYLTNEIGYFENGKMVSCSNKAL